MCSQKVCKIHGKTPISGNFLSPVFSQYLKVWSMLYHRSARQVWSKKCYLMFANTFMVFSSGLFLGNIAATVLTLTIESKVQKVFQLGVLILKFWLRRDLQRLQDCTLLPQTKSKNLRLSLQIHIKMIIISDAALLLQI